MTSFIRRLSAPGEFCLVLLGCAWFGIASSVSAIFTRSWNLAPRVRETNASLMLVILLELMSLALMFWVARVRSWPLGTWGLKPSWKLTGAGVLLCLAALLLGVAVSALSTLIAPGALHRRTEPHASLFLILLTVAINPVYEESLETGYFVQALGRFGMWTAVVASAAFRAFLHAYQGINALALIFPLGLLFALAYWKWRHLWSLFVAHALLDLYALLPMARAI